MYVLLPQRPTRLPGPWPCAFLFWRESSWECSHMASPSRPAMRPKMKISAALGRKSSWQQPRQLLSPSRTANQSSDLGEDDEAEVDAKYDQVDAVHPAHQ